MTFWIVTIPLSTIAEPAPTIPPIPASITASTRNCVRMWPWRAPTALRMPISRVRSVTVTSMMFITPIPPTSSEIAATAASNTVNVRLLLETVCSNDCWFSTLKSVELEPGWRATSTAEISLCAAVAAVFELVACTVRPSTVPELPTNSSRAVVSGMIAMLS